MPCGPGAALTRRACRKRQGARGAGAGVYGAGFRATSGRGGRGWGGLVICVQGPHVCQRPPTSNHPAGSAAGGGAGVARAAPRAAVEPWPACVQRRAPDRGSIWSRRRLQAKGRRARDPAWWARRAAGERGFRRRMAAVYVARPVGLWRHVPKRALQCARNL